MAYTKEAVSSDSSSAQPTPSSAPIMREEAIFDPRSRAQSRPVAPQGVIGQDATSVNSNAEATAPAEDTVKLSPQVAALAKREQQFRKQEQAFKERELALEAKAAKLAKLEAMEAKLAAKDYSGLDEVGVDYNEYSQYQVNKLNSHDPQQAALKALEDKVNGVEKAYKENVSKQFEAAVNERRLAVTQLVESSADKFPGIAKLKQQEAVVQHILDTWENDSEELSVEQATQEVEEILAERAKSWASIYGVPAPAQVQEPEKKGLPPMKSGLKTITNQVTAGEVKRPVTSLSHLSDSERWAEARRRAEEKLKQG